MTVLIKEEDLPKILNISSPPTPTGNQVGQGNFLIDDAGDKWYIDLNGKAIKLSNDTPDGNSYYNFTSSTQVSISTSVATTILTTTEVTIRSGKSLDIELSVPCYLNSIPSGVIVNCNVKINDTWYNLGNKGNRGFLYAYQDSTVIYDKWSMENVVDGDYTALVEFTALAVGTVAVTTNGATNKVNTLEKGLGVRGAVHEPTLNNTRAIIRER